MYYLEQHEDDAVDRLFERLRTLTARRLRAIARGDRQVATELASLRNNCLQSLAADEKASRRPQRNAA